MLYIVLVSRLSLDKFCIECFCIYSSAMDINAMQDKCSTTIYKKYVSAPLIFILLKNLDTYKEWKIIKGRQNEFPHAKFRGSVEAMLDMLYVNRIE